jgi:hypothetical protein
MLRRVHNLRGVAISNNSKKALDAQVCSFSEIGLFLYVITYKLSSFCKVAFV